MKRYAIMFDGDPQRGRTEPKLVTAVTYDAESAECDLHGRCSECPLNKIVCHQSFYPATWQADKIGVENDD